MMRTRTLIRAILVLVCMTSLAYSAITKLSRLGPATVSSAAANANHANGTSDVTIAAGAAGVRNCLSSLDLTPAGAGVFRVLDGGTTIYVVTLQANQGLVRDWDEENALCGSAAAAFRLKFTTTSAGDFNINYTGFTY